MPRRQLGGFAQQGGGMSNKRRVDYSRMRRNATTSLEAFYSTPARSLQDKEKRVMAAFTSPDVTYTRQQLSRVIGMSINGVCGRVRALLDRQALEVRGEQKCRSTGKYRELIGLPEVQG